MDRPKCPYSVSIKPQMDDYDDLQVEEVSYFDFVEEMNENLADDDEVKDTKKSFNFDSYLNSNIDY